jgi:hypothetical protein
MLVIIADPEMSEVEVNMMRTAHRIRRGNGVPQGSTFVTGIAFGRRRYLPK